MKRFAPDRVPLAEKAANTDTEYLRIIRDAIERELNARSRCGCPSGQSGHAHAGWCPRAEI